MDCENEVMRDEKMMQKEGSEDFYDLMELEKMMKDHIL